MPNYTRSALFIGGVWVPSPRGAVLEVQSPSTEAFIGSVPDADAGDVDLAVSAARKALPAWSRLPVAERSRAVAIIAQGLRNREDELTDTIVDEVGMPVRFARPFQVRQPADVMASMAELAAAHQAEEWFGNSQIVREPVGVVAAITPWNVPLHQIVAKVAPALAAGCTVVLKPSPLAPFNAFVLAEIIAAADLPAGVFNLVSGGAGTGEALVDHPDVDLVSFTGSLSVGKKVMALAADHIARVSLELGGKSASVVLADADLPRAIRTSVNQALFNTGQACNAWSRVLVPRNLLDQVLDLAAAAVANLPLGDPHDSGSRLGPVRTAEARQRIDAALGAAMRDGAEVACVGTVPADLHSRGHFVPPRVLAGVKSEMQVAQEELFGPVISVLAYDDEDEAVAIANDSPYGLGGAVWSADEARAVRVARRIRTGQVDINGGKFNLLAPFGGVKQSGIGRELGPIGLAEYLEFKSLQF